MFLFNFLQKNLKLMFKNENFYRGGNFIQRIKWLTLLIIDSSFSLSVLIIPKAILFPIHRIYADLRFYVLKQKHKVKNGKQKYNIFVERNVDANSMFKLTEEKVARAERQIERSLRNIVMINRKQIKPPITNEEKSLEVLATGQ